MAKRKNPAAVELGRRGGLARKRARTPEELSEIARAAVNARWARHIESMTDQERTAFLERRRKRRKRNG